MSACAADRPVRVYSLLWSAGAANHVTASQKINSSVYILAPFERDAQLVRYIKVKQRSDRHEDVSKLICVLKVNKYHLHSV